MGHFALLTTQKCRHHTKLSTTAASLDPLGFVAVCASTDCRTRAQLVGDLRKAYEESRLDKRMRVYLRPRLLIVDEGTIC
jgi:hypothetical protein